MIVFKLRDLLEEQGVSINQLSKDININRASLTAIANNEVKMVQLSTLQALSKYFKVPLDELMVDDSDIVKIGLSLSHTTDENFGGQIIFSYGDDSQTVPVTLTAQKIKERLFGLFFQIKNEKSGQHINNPARQEVMDAASLMKQQTMGAKIVDGWASALTSFEHHSNSFWDSTSTSVHLIFIDTVFEGALSGIYQAAKLDNDAPLVLPSSHEVTPEFDGNTTEYDKKIIFNIDFSG
ncbi:helix-turn-helix transcriptional regulator [Schleiferilactobacillus harbinensis]|uniref:Helix-turn-helix transcriptional regulator n=1 Tax=Schleiferilactobacillus harbinensis TaxID=304207 RepID=A0ABU7SZV4_9LACO